MSINENYSVFSFPVSPSKSMGIQDANVSNKKALIPELVIISSETFLKDQTLGVSNLVKPLVELANGDRMPVIGLGTWGMFDEELSNAVKTALEVGYRHIDAAFFHANEDTIGEVITEWIDGGKVTRSDLFITSKLPPTGMHPDKVKHFCMLSLQNLGLAYLDLYLLQLPVSIKYRSDEELMVYSADGSLAIDCMPQLAEIWKEMENLVEEGHVKNIGICNFKIEQLEKLLSIATIKPAVLQVELHAYLQQKDIRAFCKENNIVVTGFCPLGSPGRDDMFLNGSKLCMTLLDNPIVKKMAEKCNKSPAQVLLRHAIQNGIVVLPKSCTPERIKENFDIFSFFFTPNEMKNLNMMDKGQNARSFNYSFLGEAKPQIIKLMHIPIYPVSESTQAFTLLTMVGLSQAERAKKTEYLEILDETIRTNPFRKAATAMASVMAKHGIESNTCNTLGKMAPKVRTPEKRCALSRSLQLAQNCNLKLNIIKEDLQILCSQLSSATASGASVQDGVGERVTMAGHLLTLIGEAETIAKRIYETAVGLHVAEDFLRQPEDLKLLDFSINGRIQIPNYNFNHASQLCLEWLYSTAFKWLRGFKEEADEENGLFISIFENFTKAVKDYTESVSLANQVFRVLLYTNAIGKKSLQEYVLALGHVLRNDIIMEIQSLRRAFDSISFTFERISWAGSIVWMKYSGQNITVETLNENGLNVDHSSFQYRFYEGPQKTNRKAAQVGRKGKVMRKGSSHGNNNVCLNNRPSDKSISADNPNETDGASEKSSSLPFHVHQEEVKAAAMAAPLQSKRQSQSASDVPKPKRIIKSKKLKGKKPLAPEQEGSQGSTTTLLELRTTEDNYHVHSTVDAQNMKESEKMPSKSAPNVKASHQLIPPPTIPAALRQQFNAVFGTYPVQRKATRSGSAKRRHKRSTDIVGNKLHFISKAAEN